MKKIKIPVNQISDSLIMSKFLEQEEEIKAKLRAWIELQNNKNLHINQNSAFASNQNNISDNNATVLSNADSEKPLIIEGESNGAKEITNEEQTDFSKLLTIAIKVENGYELKHIASDDLSKNAIEGENYVVLVDWSLVIPKSPTLDDVDKIMNDSKNALSKSLKNSFDRIVNLSVLDDYEIFTEKVRDESNKPPNIKDFLDNKKTALTSSLAKLMSEDEEEVIEEDDKPTKEGVPSIADFLGKEEEVIEEDDKPTKEGVPSIADLLGKEEEVIEEDDKPTKEGVLSVEETISSTNSLVNEEDKYSTVENTLPCAHVPNTSIVFLQNSVGLNNGIDSSLNMFYKDDLVGVLDKKNNTTSFSLSSKELFVDSLIDLSKIPNSTESSADSLIKFNNQNEVTFDNKVVATIDGDSLVSSDSHLLGSVVNEISLKSEWFDNLYDLVKSKSFNVDNIAFKNNSTFFIGNNLFIKEKIVDNTQLANELSISMLNTVLKTIQEEKDNSLGVDVSESEIVENEINANVENEAQNNLAGRHI